MTSSINQNGSSVRSLIMRVSRLWLVVIVLCAATMAQAQSPCAFSTTEVGKIVETCGTVGVGTTLPWGGLHVSGAGQSASNPVVTTTSAAQNGATLFVQDSANFAGSGGMVGFGAASGPFAAIKGSLVDGTSNTIGQLIFATRNLTSDTTLTERMRLLPNGHLSIGTPADLGFRTNVYDTLTVTANGHFINGAATFRTGQNVGAGLSSTGASSALQAIAANEGNGSLFQTMGNHIWVGISGGTSGSVTNAFGTYVQIVKGSGTIANGFGLYVEDVQATNGWGIYQAGSTDGNYFAGKVGIGTAPTGNALEVVGNVNFQGTVTGTNIQAKYQDVAEWVPSRDDLEPGTVVVLDAALGNGVMASTSAYDTAVAGVVSAQPGIILGEGGAAKEQVATTGRVRVKVDASRGAIRVGDLLVTSDKRGVAMRSEAIEIAGRRIHQPGTILGKALEALPSGEGEILVLLSLQ